MAEYRTIKMSFWNDPFIEELEADEKLLYLYLFTCSHTNNLGFLEVTRKRIAFESGVTAQRVAEILARLENAGKLVMDGNAIWLTNFIKNQCATSEKLVTGLKTLFAEISSQKIRQRMQERYPDIFGKPDTPSIPHAYPIDTPCIPIGEEEGEEEFNLNLTPPNGGVVHAARGVHPPTPEPALPEPALSEPSLPEQPLPKSLPQPLPERPQAATALLKAQESPPKKGSPPPCPHTEIIALYGKILPELPGVKVWDETRKRHLQARWRERWAAQKYRTQPDGLAYWERLFRHIHENCDWLMGRVNGSHDRPPFRASLPWLVEPGNFAKLIEGTYDNRRGAD